MLASITPLGERGRGSRWLVTVTAFALGATAAGALAGAAAGAVGAVTLDRLTDSDGRLAMLAAGLVAALALDLRRAAVPGPRRQVNERWLDEFRGWVYGVGFGFQLGLGLTTVVTSAATYAAVLAALLSGSAPAGALTLGLYGAIRGLTPLAGARVHRPDQLVALHRSLERWRRPVRQIGAAGLAVLVVACAGAAL